MGKTIPIDGLADAINEGLKEYADLATEDVKKAVKKSAKAVKKGPDQWLRAGADRPVCKKLEGKDDG